MSKTNFNYYGQWYAPINNFAEAKARYESIVPIRGKRAELDLRPLDSRHTYQVRHRIVKVSNKEYSVTAHYEGLWGKPTKSVRGTRALSFFKDGRIVLYPFNVGPTSLNLISQCLPEHMYLHRHDSKIYLAINRPASDGVTYRPEYYCLMPDRSQWYTSKLTLRQVDGEWVVPKPYIEKRYRIDRKATAKLFAMKRWREFEEYVETIWPMVDQATAEAVPDWPYIYNSYGDLPEKTEWLQEVVRLKGSTYVWTNGLYNSGKHVLKQERYSRCTLDSHRADWKRRHKHRYQIEDVPVGEVCTTPRWLRR